MSNTVEGFLVVDELDCNALSFIKCLVPLFGLVKQKVFCQVIFSETPLMTTKQIMVFNMVADCRT